MSKKKDWVGGRASVFKTLGASNHTEHDRSWGDYYATEPAATEWLLKLEQFDAPILEPACGEGHISKVLMRGGIPSLHAISSTEAMARWPIFWPSTTWNGQGTSSPTRLMPMLRSLWRKHSRLSQRERKSACFSNSLSSKERTVGICSRHNRQPVCGSAAHVCYAP